MNKLRALFPQLTYKQLVELQMGFDEFNKTITDDERQRLLNFNKVNWKRDGF